MNQVENKRFQNRSFSNCIGYLENEEHTNTMVSDEEIRTMIKRLEELNDMFSSVISTKRNNAMFYSSTAAIIIALMSLILSTVL